MDGKYRCPSCHQSVLKKTSTGTHSFINHQQTHAECNAPWFSSRLRHYINHLLTLNINKSAIQIHKRRYEYFHLEQELLKTTVRSNIGISETMRVLWYVVREFTPAADDIMTMTYAETISLLLTNLAYDTALRWPLKTHRGSLVWRRS